MKLNIKFSEGYKYVFFDPNLENEIAVDSYGYRFKITDKKCLERFAFFFKNVDFSLSYTVRYQEFQFDITHFCSNCVSRLSRTDINRLRDFVDSLTSTDEKSVEVRFFENNQKTVFAMKGDNIIALYGGEENGFIEKISRNDFHLSFKNEHVNTLYMGGYFKPVFETLL